MRGAWKEAEGLIFSVLGSAWCLCHSDECIKVSAVCMYCLSCVCVCMRAHVQFSKRRPLHVAEKSEVVATHPGSAAESTNATFDEVFGMPLSLEGGFP